jgi:hypothetical protein
MANVAAAIRLADRVYLFDNSVEDVEARLCVRIQDGTLRKVYGPLPRWVEGSIEGVAKHVGVRRHARALC